MTLLEKIKNYKWFDSPNKLRAILEELYNSIGGGSGGGTQDLQSVLDNGQNANAQIHLFDGESFVSTSTSGNTIGIGDGSVNGHNILSSSVISINFTNRTAAGDMMLTFDPNKPNGNYRIATLDDLLNINLNSRVYADNAAAITGGLRAKDLYRTATGELRIVV